MSTDTRTPQERAYDAAALSRPRETQPEAPAEQPDGLTRIFEHIEAITADEPSPADDLLIAARWLDAQMSEQAKQQFASVVDEENDDRDPTPEQIAAWDAESRAVVGSLVGRMMQADRTAELFIDTLPGRINGTPIDVLVVCEIGGALERNQRALGITREQVFAILDHVCAACEVLETPRRKMELLWSGERTEEDFELRPRPAEPIRPAETPQHPANETDRDMACSIGYACGGLTVAVERMDSARAEALARLLNRMADTRGAVLDALVDSILAAA